MALRPQRTACLALAASLLFVVALLLVLGWRLAVLESPPPTVLPPSEPARPHAAEPAGLDPPPPSPRLLAIARELLGDDRRELECGAYLLLTDVADSPLTAACARLASTLDAVYRRRYGLDPRGEARGAVVLFARRADFREMARRDGLRAGYAGYSSAGDGLVVLSAEGGDRDELLRTLAHELTHLVHRRALGPGLAPWLSEGLADGVGDSAAADGWRPLAGLDGIEGPAARLAAAYRAGRVSGLERLVTLDRSRFDRETVSYDYEQSALFVRFLLTDPELAGRFRSYLQRLAAGERYAPGELRSALGREWSELDRELEGFVLAHGRHAGVVDGGEVR